MTPPICYSITISLVTQFIYSTTAPQVPSLTQICFKNGSKTPPQLHPAANFLQLLQNSDIIVDKSLLLKTIFSPDAPIVTLITAPRQYGKSINLDMIAFFARCEFDKNYTQINNRNTSAYMYFKNGQISYHKKTYIFNKPPLISSHHQLIDEHLAKYVVLKVDLSNITVKDENSTISFDAFCSSFQNAIQQTFIDNQFVLDVMDTKYFTGTYETEDAGNAYARFQRHRNNEELNTDELIDSIHFLCNMINAYTETWIWIKSTLKKISKPVLLIIDQYDKPFDMYFDLTMDGKHPEAIQICTFMHNFFNETLNLNKHYKRAIVAGTVQILKMTTMSYATIDSLFPFYGYTDQEVRELLQLAGLTSKYKEVEKMYKGYYSIGHPDSPIFNLCDITNVMKTATVKGYWIESQSVDVLFNLMKHYYKFKLVFASLLNKDLHFSIPKQSVTFSGNFYKNIANFTGNKKSDARRDHEVVEIMSTLLSIGYLTPTNKHHSTDTIDVRIANDEIDQFTRTLVNRHYSTLLGDDLVLYTNARRAFEQFFDSESENSTLLQDPLEVLLRARNITQDLLNELNYSTNQRNLYPRNLYKISLHNLVHKVLVLSQVQKTLNLGATFFANLSVEFYPFSDISNLFAYRNDKALIIRLKCDDKVTIDHVLDQAFKYTSNLYKNSKTYRVIKYVAINLKNGNRGKTKPTLEIKTATKTKH